MADHAHCFGSRCKGILSAHSGNCRARVGLSTTRVDRSLRSTGSHAAADSLVLVRGDLSISTPALPPSSFMSHHHLLSSSLPSSSSSLSSPPPLMPLSSWPLPRCFHHASRSRHRPLFLLCLPYNCASSRVMLALAPDLMQALIARFSRMIAHLDRSKCVRLITLTSPYLMNHLKVPVDIHHAPPFFPLCLCGA
jgi:hypothetical protein